MLLGDGNDKNNNTLIGAIQMNANIMLFDLYIRKGNFFFFYNQNNDRTDHNGPADFFHLLQSCNVFESFLSEGNFFI